VITAGALYMQVLVPWLCAWNAGQPSHQLRGLVQRLARAILHAYSAHRSVCLRREVTERMHVQYLQAAELALWGGRQLDVMQSAFYDE
jgi:hypothetical protein